MARRFPVAVHIFFLHRGEVLLLRRLNTGYEDGDFLMTVRRWSGEPSNCEPTKCDDLSWSPLDALPSNTTQNLI